MTGVDLLRKVIIVRPVLTAMANTAAAVYSIFPGRKEIKNVQTVIDAAVKGAELAEEAWRMGALEREERNAYAKQWIANTLAEAGIKVTPQIQMVIDGAIEATCMILPRIVKQEENEEA